MPEYPLAFEIGLSGRHHRRGLNALTGRYPRFEGRCYLIGTDSIASRPEDSWDNIGTLPLDLFLLAVGAQAEHELARRLST